MPSPINNFLRTCPDSPGIYKFFHNNQIIYIGKAKNLSKRVRSYFTKSLKDRKTEQIKKLTDKIETFITHSEAEALTTYGIIGIKIWIYKGEIFTKEFSQERNKA